MFGYFLLGVTFAFAAVAQPGPSQAWLIAQTASHGWRRTLPAAFSPLLSDVPVILLTMLALSRLPAWFTTWLRLAGGVFVLYLAFGALRTWRRFDPRKPPAPAPGGSLMRATLVNLLNPNPWLCWSLVLGPLLLKAWRQAPSHAVALLAGFYGVLVLGLAATIVLFGMARKLGPGVTRALIGLSAVALALFGCWLLWPASSLGG
jgi:threonine/homoserine/homoserine lactone efflux protein